jgi:hypothetical protein
MTTYKPPPWFEALVNASDQVAFDVAMRDARPPKRGRPSKADAEREAAYAEYLERIITGSPPPGGWPLVETDRSVRVPEARKVGRPADVDPRARAPFEQQYEKNFVERFIGHAAWVLRFEKKRYRRQEGAGKYVPADKCDKMLERILSQLPPEFLRLASKFANKLDKRFLDQVEALKRMVGTEDDRLYLRDDDRRKLKERIVIRERNLGQRISGGKRLMKRRTLLKKQRKGVS